MAMARAPHLLCSNDLRHQDGGWLCLRSAHQAPCLLIAQNHVTCIHEPFEGVLTVPEQDILVSVEKAGSQNGLGQPHCTLTLIPKACPTHGTSNIGLQCSNGCISIKTKCLP